MFATKRKTRAWLVLASVTFALFASRTANAQASYSLFPCSQGTNCTIFNGTISYQLQTCSTTNDCLFFGGTHIYQCINGLCQAVSSTACTANPQCPHDSFGNEECGQSGTCAACTGNGTSVCCYQPACLPGFCGVHPDNCGDTALNCGGCTAPNTCGGGGIDGQCGCTPLTCNSPGVCGTRADGCGGTLHCNPCPTPAAPTSMLPLFAVGFLGVGILAAIKRRMRSHG
jgi:hypothetical protein